MKALRNNSILYWLMFVPLIGGILAFFILYFHRMQYNFYNQKKVNLHFVLGVLVLIPFYGLFYYFYYRLNYTVIPLLIFFIFFWVYIDFLFNRVYLFVKFGNSK